MGMFDGFNIAATGLTAQRLRMDVISNNIANATTTRTPEGGAYRRRRIIQSPFRLNYDPSHPDAIQIGPKRGYVEMPNVNVVMEMTDLISASRSYEANITMINSERTMFNRALELGRISG
jgi:flagellar basal-body rod protein FlgC